MKEQKSTDEALVGLDGSEQENTESDVCTDTVDGVNLIDDLKATIVRNDNELNESKVRINELEQVIDSKEQEKIGRASCRERV